MRVTINGWRLYGEFDRTTGTVVLYPRKKSSDTKMMLVMIGREKPDEVGVLIAVPGCQSTFKFNPKEAEPKRLEFCWSF